MKTGLYCHCKACAKLARAHYRANSPTLAERERGYSKQYAKRQREKRLASLKKWRDANQEKQKELIAQWKKLNKDKTRAYASKRRSQKLNAIPPWFEKEKVALAYKKAKEWGFEVDHVIPLQGKNVCGLHCWSNLQLLDAKLNHSKGNRRYPDH